jgi:hypothetical protein
MKKESLAIWFLRGQEEINPGQRKAEEELRRTMSRLSPRTVLYFMILLLGNRRAVRHNRSLGE